LCHDDGDDNKPVWPARATGADVLVVL
jgi:hypothetical protein